MNSVAEYIQSGILEMYVLGVTSQAETREVEEMAVKHPEIQKEIEAIMRAMEKYADSHALAPHQAIKPLLLASIDYQERLKNGEAMSFPPELNAGSKIEDYKEWLDRKDMILPDHFEDFHARIIGYTPQMTSAIVWIKYMAPDEVHDKEYEKFLIVEGTCEITIGEEVHKLKAGDYLPIPLHVSHYVKVTSEIPCKIILQRIAA